MKCPTCPDQTLTMTDRQGIEIDYCPECRGVWLDRGEIDKLIERSVMAAATAPNNAAPRRQPDFDDSEHDHNRGRHGSRKKSWRSGIID